MATSIAATGKHRDADTHPMDSSRLFLTLLQLAQNKDLHDQANTKNLVSPSVFKRLLSALHFRDSGTLKHSRRVGLISVGIAARLGWEDDDLRVIEIAALLHDIGKIGIPDHIFRKPGKLSPDESEFIAVYHRVGLTLLQTCQVHSDVVSMIAQAHGVDDEELSLRGHLSLGARILAVADAYDSLTTKQSFRAPFDRWEALQILEEQSGKQFDRNVVAALGRWLDSSDATRLADERAAEVSIHVHAPVDKETRSSAILLCHIFHHLYLLESLYEAFYMIDAKRRVTIWSSGANSLFGVMSHSSMRKRWNRSIISPNYAATDPIESVFVNGESVCHSTTIKNKEDVLLDVEIQTVPICNEDGTVCAVVELVCNSKESKKHRGQFRNLQIAASRDPLTGVLNRGELERQSNNLYEDWCESPEKSFSVIFMDLDYFKKINDRYSHAFGDKVLIDVSRLLQDELYSGELIGRYGGEEFVILCPETDLEAARERAERLRRTIMATPFSDHENLSVTASFGVAEVSNGDTLKSVMDRADAAMYESKSRGRNQTSLAKKTETQAPSRKKPERTQNTRHTSAIMTHVAGDMLHRKLLGFVESIQAKILDVKEDSLQMQIGQTRFLSGWTKPSTENMPIKLSIEMSDIPGESSRSTASKMLLKIVVDPIGRGVDAKMFNESAARAVDELRAYLMATDVN